MGNNLLALSGFLTDLPGIWILHLIPSSALAALVFLNLPNNGNANPIRQRHMLAGCLVLLLFQVVSLAIYLMYPSAIFQIVESTLAALTVIWVSWLLLEEQKKTLQTGAALVLTAGVLDFSFLSLLNFRLYPFFSRISLQAVQVLWQYTGLILVFIGLVLVLIRRPNRWIPGGLILACLGLGFVLELTLVSEDFGAMVWIQISQALSLPCLLIPVRRGSTKEILPQEKKQPQANDILNQPVDTKPRLVDQLLQINLQENANDRRRATVRALSLSLLADICYLVQILPDSTHIELIAGYDLIREVHLPTPTLDRSDLIHIMDAWADQRVLRLSQAHEDVQDVATLTLLLKYHRIGNLLAYPLHLPNEPAVGGIIIFSPYTNKFFDSNTFSLLDEVQVTLAKILFGRNPIDKVNVELEQKTDLAAILRQTVESLNQVLSEKETMISALKTDLQQYKAKYQVEKLDSVQQIEALQKEIHILRVQPVPQDEWLRREEQLSSQLRQLTDERDRLRMALSRAEARIKHLEIETGQTGPTRLSMDNQIISLDSIAANVRLQMASQLQDKAQNLEIINPEGRQMVRTDPELLQTILQGLLENAIAISPIESAIQLRLDISLETGMLIAEVTDHGEGLTQDEQTLLFSATETQIPGIGSLPAIRAAIRAIRILNGKIWLRSFKHRSTTFRVQFPIRIID